MTREALSAIRRAGWIKRREMYGPRGHGIKQAWRRKLGARAKRLAEQSVVANVTRETSEAGT